MEETRQNGSFPAEALTTSIQLQGIVVQLVFASEKNPEAASRVREILKDSFLHQQSA